MADDWQPGDLAMALRNLPRGKIHAGQILTVSKVICDRTIETGELVTGLIFADWPMPPEVTGFAARRFRKIRPHTPDAEDAETIALLTGKPAQVPA